MANDDLADKIEEIRQMFLQRARDEWLARIIALRSRPADDWARPTLDEMMFLTHTLAGSAATFGFKSLSDVALKIEIAVRKIIKDASEGTAEAKSEITAGMERLESETRLALQDLKA